MAIANEFEQQLNLHEHELTAIGAKMVSAKSAPTDAEFIKSFELWQSHMFALGERIAEGISDFAGLIDTEKVQAMLGADGAMVIDDNTLILPPEGK